MKEGQEREMNCNIKKKKKLLFWKYGLKCVKKHLYMHTHQNTVIVHILQFSE